MWSADDPQPAVGARHHIACQDVSEAGSRLPALAFVFSLSRMKTASVQQLYTSFGCSAQTIILKRCLLAGGIRPWRTDAAFLGQEQGKKRSIRESTK